MYTFCAASYYVRAIIPKKNKLQSKIMYSYASQSRSMMSLYFSKIYKKTATNGEISNYREKYLLLLEKEFCKNKKLLKDTVENIVQCDGKQYISPIIQLH